jgi:ectoine hydroxylase-related dioxygenase (phytanoyl-CoA dioxygenase family)
MTEEKNFFNENGYIVIRDVFTEEEVEDYREIIANYFDNYPYLHWMDNRTDAESKMFSGWATSPKLREPGLEKLLGMSSLKDDPRTLKWVSNFFDNKGFVFMEESDLHENVNTPVWHRDTVSPTSNLEDNKIIKVCLLFQDHLDEETGLWMKPQSHLDSAWKNRGLDYNAEWADKESVRDDLSGVCVNSRKTDVVIFNQRTIHKGHDGYPSYAKRYNRNRYFITFSYGLDNEYTKAQIAVTAARQTKQQSQMRR